MKKTNRVIGTPSGTGSFSASAARNSKTATTPESRPSVMRVLGWGSATPPPIGAKATPPGASTRWVNSWRSGGVTPGKEAIIFPKCSVTVAGSTSRHIPPLRSKASIRQFVVMCGASGARNPACAARPRPAAHVATWARSKSNRPRSGVWGRPSLRIQPSMTASETPKDSAIWVRLRYMEWKHCPEVSARQSRVLSVAVVSLASSQQGDDRKSG